MDKGQTLLDRAWIENIRGKLPIVNGLIDVCVYSYLFRIYKARRRCDMYYLREPGRPRVFVPCVVD